MTAYLLKSGLCLLLTYGLYKVWLENERMHQFKRFYLLASLLLAAVIPIISISFWAGSRFFTADTALGPTFYSPDHPTVLVLSREDAPSSPVDTAWPYYLLPYLIVTVFLFLRFVRNSIYLLSQAQRQPKRSFQGVTLVRANGLNLPYTFLHFIFIDKTAFDQDDLNNELLTHELTHARQWHTLDVLLVELFLCVGWFNPLVWQFKKAIQLNHEFIADEAVNHKHQQVTLYQKLLLGRVGYIGPAPLTSALTFQTTKQRFVMMTKHTPVFRIWLAGGTAIAMLLALPMLFGASTVAQTTQPSTLPTQKATTRQAKPTAVDSDFEQRFGDKLVLIPGRPGKPSVRKKYSQLSPSEKMQVQYIPPQERKTPTEAEFSTWKNSKKFGVWVDGKRTRNFASTSLKASDIASYSGSYVHKNARQPEGYLYQMDLMTHDNYKAYLKESEENPFIVLMTNPAKAR